MRILHVSYHCCIRNLKQGFALQRAGHDNAYLCCFMANDEYRYDVPMISYWPIEAGPFEKCKHFQDYDIIHVHHEPNFGYFLSRLRESFPKIPIVFDAHDLDLIRFPDTCGEVSMDAEMKAFNDYDGFVYPCETYKSESNRLFDIKDKPEAVIYSKVFPEVADIKKMPHVGGIAYQGGITVNPKNKFKDLRDLAKWFYDSNIPFHIHGSNSEVLKSYTETGALLYGPQSYFKLMRSLSRYDWGLCAGPFEDKANHWHKSMPNKLFEYAAVGLPILTWHESEIADYVREKEIGIVLDNIEDLYERYSDHILIRDNLNEKRHEFTMKSELPKIEKLYEDVINGF